MPFYYRNPYAPFYLNRREVHDRHRFAEDQDDRKHRAVRRLQRERARLHEEKAAKMNEMNALMARKATLEQEIRAVDVLIGRVNGAIEVELDK